MKPDPRLVTIAVAGTRHSLEAAVKLLAAGASQVLKHAGVLRAEAEVAHMLYHSVVEIVKVVERSEREKADRAKGSEESPG